MKTEVRYKVKGISILDGAIVKKLRESQRTGQWTCEIVEPVKGWEKGSKVILAPYQLERYS